MEKLPTLFEPYLEFFHLKEEKDNAFIFKCKYGCKEYSASKTTASNLRLHLKRKHPLLLEKMQKAQEETRKRKREDSVEQPPITKMIKLSKKTELSKEQIDRAVVDLLLGDNMPFSLLDSQNFKEFVSKLSGQPADDLLSRKKANTLLEDKMKQLKKIIIEDLERVEQVCVTADCWTAHHRSFLGVTCHYLEYLHGYERKSAALACRRIKGPHTYDVLAEHLDSILKEYKIQNKVHRIVTDNGSNFVKAFRIFGQTGSPCAEDQSDDDEEQDEVTSYDFLGEGPSSGSTIVLPPHLRCAAHTINLVASKDSEAALQGHTFKTASRSMFGKASALWTKQSKTVLAAENIKEETGKQLIVPNQTRWNSTFDAVKCLSDLSPDSLGKICDKLGLARFTSRDHLFMKEFVMVMGPVAKSLDYLQGEKCVGLGSLLPQLETMKARIELEKCKLEICRPLADAVLQGIAIRFKEAYEDRDTLLAAVSDPRLKLSWTGNVKLKETAKMLLTNEVMSLKPPAQTAVKSQTDEDFILFDNVADVAESTAYLTEGLAKSLDELDKYPGVKAVFLRTNTSLPSSAAVERLFSQAGLILTKIRARVTDSNFEAKVLVKYNSKKGL